MEGTLSGEVMQKIHQTSFELSGVTDKDKFIAQVENVKSGKLTDFRHPMSERTSDVSVLTA